MLESQGEAGKRRVTLRVKAPFAGEVIAVGDFNNWNPETHPLEKDREGLWKVTLSLTPGKYEYKLLIDGRWWEGNPDGKSVRNPFGTLNRVLYVPGK